MIQGWYFPQILFTLFSITEIAKYKVAIQINCLNIFNVDADFLKHYKIILFSNFSNTKCFFLLILLNLLYKEAFKIVLWVQRYKIIIYLLLSNFNNTKCFFSLILLNLLYIALYKKSFHDSVLIFWWFQHYKIIIYLLLSNCNNSKCFFSMILRNLL